MPIRFACLHCGQRLSVGSQKAGQTATCPKCQAKIDVPTLAEPEPAEPIAEPPLANEPPLIFVDAGRPERSSFDFEGGVEVVFETSASPPSRKRRPPSDDEVDLDRISLPRYVIYTQGILLAVVGILCFLLGMAVGGALENGGGQVATTPATVTGLVAITNDGNRAPDGGAVVIFLPLDAKPDEKGKLEGIRPGDDPAAGESVRRYVQLLGGGVARCDGRGEYSLQLPDRGRYYLLTISSSARPPRNRRVNPQEIAQMGRYFDLAADPLSEHRHQWRLETIRGNQKANVTFD